MALDILLFVSKRLQPVALALICLAFAQLVAAAASPSANAPQAQTVWRAAIAGR